MDLYSRTLELVYSHLEGTTPLDARYSDMQVSLAQEAFKVFKPVPQVEGGICEHCGEPNIAHMGYECRTGR